jgi:hypothetical protein
MVTLPQTAHLAVKDLSKVKQLEEELGVVLIAYAPTEFANLDDKQVKELQKVEKTLKATVIAYR